MTNLSYKSTTTDYYQVEESPQLLTEYELEEVNGGLAPLAFGLVIAGIMYGPAIGAAIYAYATSD